MKKRRNGSCLTNDCDVIGMKVTAATALCLYCLVLTCAVYCSGNNVHWRSSKSTIGKRKITLCTTLHEIPMLPP